MSTMPDLKTNGTSQAASPGQQSYSAKRGADPQENHHGRSLKKLQGPSHLGAHDLAQLATASTAHIQEATVAGTGAAPTAQAYQQDPHVPALLQVRAHTIEKAKRKGRRSLIVTLQAPTSELSKLPLRPRQRPDIPDPGGRCFLLAVPLEIRDEVYRHLLRAEARGARPATIHLLRAWDRVYPRWPRGLHIGILLACRQTAAEGVRVLYGENTFRYLVRDTDEQQQQQQERSRAEQLTMPGSVEPGLIDMAQFGPFVRHLSLMVESNRLRAAGEAVSSALEMLSAPGAAFPSLDTVAMSVIYNPAGPDDYAKLTESILYWFSRGGRLVKALKALRCNSFDLVIHHGGPECCRHEVQEDSGDLPVWYEDVPKYISLGARFELRYLGKAPTTTARGAGSTAAVVHDFLTESWMEKRAQVFERLNSLRWMVEGAAFKPRQAISMGVWERRPPPF